MNQLLLNIFKTKTFKTHDNQVISVHSETGQEQCEFLQNIIRTRNFSKSIEVGFAYGTSTLAITEEIVKNGGKHVVIDKFEVSDWKSHGLDLMTQAGHINDIEFHEEYCYVTLPKLLEQGRKFDFAYIDSTKQLDWLLVDFFYIDKMMEVNGVIVFDDTMFQSIRKLMRYISQFPNYHVLSQFPGNELPVKNRRLVKLVNLFKNPESILKEEILLSDYDLGINARAVALIKTEEDTRNWDWHVNF